MHWGLQSIVGACGARAPHRRPEATRAHAAGCASARSGPGRARLAKRERRASGGAPAACLSSSRHTKPAARAVVVATAGSTRPAATKASKRVTC